MSISAQVRTILVVTATLLALLAGSEERVEAYPQFQFSTGNTRCGICHYTPSGGGLINGWGRSEASDTISNGGDGAFLHGAWETPDWLALGADFRAVAGAKDTEATGIDPLLFPMQADLYTRFDFGSVKVTSTVGLRGSARPRDPPATSLVYPRELFVTYQPESTGFYARAGRFMAPYGLRQIDHTTYIRRDLGMYAWEETIGVSAGFIEGNDWELHGTIATRDPLMQVGRAGQSLSLLYEKRLLEETASWGAQSRVQVGVDSVDYWLGGLYKMYFESLDLLLLSEVDFGVRDIDTENADPILQGIAHANLTYFITNGWMLGGTVEAKQSDFGLAGKDSEAATVSIQYFPKAHFELMLYGKAERSRQTRSVVSFLMFHYYL